MSTYNVPIVMGVFHSQTEVKKALEALREAGFQRDQIGVAWQQDADTTEYINSLINFGLAQEQAEYYDQEFRTGHPVISVRPDGHERDAYRILRNYGAYDYDQRDSSVSPDVQSSYSNREARKDGTEQPASGEEWRSIPIREERLRVNKQSAPIGEVRLYKDVVTEQQDIDVPVYREEVIVERHPGSGEVSDTPIGQEETIRIPLHREQVSINKVPVETGEVVIGKRMVRENQRVTDTVRREEPRIEKEGNPIIHANDDLENA
ncbi:MAG: YsnF/AvaK domain-containing protein [Ktedonobacteraceae bacterium]|nr:YsnF/AvaK domain-containing protein [Ktedonobacteraceae bacterium]